MNLNFEHSEVLTFLAPSHVKQWHPLASVEKEEKKRNILDESDHLKSASMLHMPFSSHVRPSKPLVHLHAREFVFYNFAGCITFARTANATLTEEMNV